MNNKSAEFQTRSIHPDQLRAAFLAPICSLLLLFPKYDLLDDSKRPQTLPTASKTNRKLQKRGFTRWMRGKMKGCEREEFCCLLKEICSRKPIRLTASLQCPDIEAYSSPWRSSVCCCYNLEQILKKWEPVSHVCEQESRCSSRHVQTNVVGTSLPPQLEIRLWQV